jgi:ribosomal protein L18E
MINNHKDITKPYYVAKKDNNTVFHYGKITEGQVFSTIMPIKAYVHKQSMINFIERNGGEYIDLEL